MMTPTHHRTCGHLIAACFLLICTAVVHAQTGPPAPAPPTASAPAQNVVPETPAAPVKVVPRVDRGPSPLGQLGLAPGSVHKIGVGLGVAKFKTINGGTNGWVSFECLESNNAGWVSGEKYWINTNNVVFISAPFVETKAAPAPATPAPAPKAAPAPTATKPKSKAKP